MPDQALGNMLLAIAHEAIAREFGAATPTHIASAHAALEQPGATFITLTQQGRLRGCIGSLEAWRTLRQDVAQNAVAAAFRDPRFPPLSADELPVTRVEVSLLTPAEPMPCADEADALVQLVPERDGIILECHGRRATFLPQVWEQLPDKRQFMAHLKQKAGFAADWWSPDVRLFRYRVEKWKDE